MYAYESTVWESVFAKDSLKDQKNIFGKGVDEQNIPGRE